MPAARGPDNAAIRAREGLNRTLPWHKAAAEISEYFTSKRYGDPLNDRGWDQLVASGKGLESFKNELYRNLPGLQTSEHFETINSVIDNTFSELNNPFGGYTTNGRSSEGLDAMAPNANYNQFARLNPFTIIGYIARSKVIDLYHTVNSDRPTITYEYNYEYILKGDDPTMYQMPQAIRDGSLTGILDLPRAIPQPAADGSTPWIQPLTDPNFIAPWVTPSDPNPTTTNWITIGSEGNLLAESGWPPMNHMIERNVQIAAIRWVAPITGSSTGFVGYTPIMLDREYMLGDQTERVFNQKLTISWVDTGAPNTPTKTANLTIIGTMNLDTGIYSVGQTGPTQYITHFLFDAKVTNLANDMGSIRGGAKKFIQTFDVNNKITGTVPISQLMADDFNLAGEGVTYTAFMVDKMTEAYAGFRDLEMERELNLAYAKAPQAFRMFVKLGGYDAGGTPTPFILSARGAGGGGSSMYDWVRDGLKDMVRHLLSYGDIYMQFENATPREWMIYGSEIDIQRFPDVSYTNYAGEGVDDAAPGNYRYGFSLDTSAGFMDNFGRRVKVIGNKDLRRLGQPLVAQLKSASLEQPTTVYFPYSFRVFSGISPEYGKLPALCIFQRDYIGTLTKAQVRISLQGNNPALYQTAAAFSAGQPNGVPTWAPNTGTPLGYAGNAPISSQNGIPVTN